MSMRILFLADANSIHTRKLAIGLSARGCTVAIFSLSKAREHDSGIRIYDDDSVPGETIHGSNLKKLAYLKKRRAVKRTIAEFNPDIVHAHYASSYGLLGWMADFHPYILSVWGSDVLDFPKGFLKIQVMNKILKSADRILSTSETLRKAVKQISDCDSELTPFGVDVEIFKPANGKRNHPAETTVFTIVKSLEKVYNIDVAIRAFAKLHDSHSNCVLEIAGEGTQRIELHELVTALGLDRVVRFAGRIPNTGVASFLNQGDVFLNLSQYESFGVSVIEAMACAKPVIATNTGGLAEIIHDGMDGMLVPVNDVDATVKAMLRLHLERQTRIDMGANGRESVLDKYNFNFTLNKISAIYAQIGGKR